MLLFGLPALVAHGRPVFWRYAGIRSSSVLILFTKPSCNRRLRVSVWEEGVKQGGGWDMKLLS